LNAAVKCSGEEINMAEFEQLIKKRGAKIIGQILFPVWLGNHIGAHLL